MLWLYLALGTAIAWGAGYAMSEKFLHNGVSSPFFLACLTLCATPIYFLLAVQKSEVAKSIDILKNDKSILFAFIACIAVYIIGNLFITYAIQLKNATYANLIEITYPLFTVFFTYILYRSFHLNAATMIGAVMILCGVLLIIYKGHS